MYMKGDVSLTGTKLLNFFFSLVLNQSLTCVPHNSICQIFLQRKRKSKCKNTKGTYDVYNVLDV